MALVSVGWAQETPEVHKINGKKYYLHLVEKGNTLYGISRLYNVEVEAINNANQEALIDGLKENQTLLIPVTSENKKEIAQVTQNENLLIHRVQPKETLFSISKKYEVPLEKLLLTNPEIRSNGLKAGSEIRIPIAEAQVDKTSIKPAEEDSLETHTIVAGDTPYSISKKYGITLEELAAVNQNRSLLTIGDKLRIPGTSKPKKPAEKLDSLASDEYQVKAQDSGHVYHIALLLPIQPTFPDSSKTSTFQISGGNRIALEYLRGFRFALDSLKNSYAASLKVHVFPMNNDSASIRHFMASPFYDSIDIAIGPFYSSQFEFIADMLADSGVIAICPINKPSKILFKRPNAIKTVASESMQLHGIANFIIDRYIDSNLILVNSNKFQDTQNLEFFKQELAKAVGQADTVTEDVIPEIQLWDINQASLNLRFKDSGKYILIVPSKDQVFVTRLIGGLYDFMLDSKGKFTFQVYGLESWQSWQDGLNLKQLQALKLTLPISDYIDMNDYKTHNLYKSYYRQFGFEPEEFTIHGFDHCQYLFQSLSDDPKSWFVNPENTSFTGHSNDFNFVRVLDNSGVENQTVKFYEIKDYQLTNVGQWPLEKKK